MKDKKLLFKIAAIVSKILTGLFAVFSELSVSYALIMQGILMRQATDIMAGQTFIPHESILWFFGAFALIPAFGAALLADYFTERSCKSNLIK